MAAQEQALSSNVMRSKIFNLPVSSLCRLCGATDETVDPLISSCHYVAQSQYKKRHNTVASYIHWMLSQNNGFSIVEKWWQHKPEDVLKSSNRKIMWDFTIYTGLNLAHDCPDITVMYKSSPSITYLIDITIPGDSRLHQKFVEKKERYSNLYILINKLWRTSCIVVPIAVSSLESIPISLSAELQKIGIAVKAVPIMQKSVILNICRLLHRYLT